MIEITEKEVMNFKGALRGMRNPMESWSQSDSFLDSDLTESGFRFIIGKNDLKLAQKLILAGTDHSKFMRQIFVSMDINAPLYWWKEMDTYKVATVANSCSTMHKLATTPITFERFSFDDYAGELDDYMFFLEYIRQDYLKTKNPETWKFLVQLLPESWNQKRTWTANYQTLRNIYFARKNHKLSEWFQAKSRDWK